MRKGFVVRYLRVDQQRPSTAFSRQQTVLRANTQQKKIEDKTPTEQRYWWGQRGGEWRGKEGWRRTEWECEQTASGRQKGEPQAG